MSNILDKLGLSKSKEVEKETTTEEVVKESAPEVCTAPEPTEPAIVAPIVATQPLEDRSPVDRKPETKRVSSEPWKPASLISIPEHLKEPGRTYRWVDSGKDGNFQKKLAEGWVVDEDLSKKLNQVSASMHDSGNINSTTKVRELIVMWIPNERAEARNAYYNSKIVDGKQMKKNMQNEANAEGDGHLVYGDVTRER
jgi:hypothetical protein